jgi:hypothetical protein
VNAQTAHRSEALVLKKLLVLAAIAAAGYVAYSKVTQAQEERDLWNEATAAPDLR